MKRSLVKGTTVQTGNIVKRTMVENGRETTVTAIVEYVRERVGSYSVVLVRDINYKSIKIACNA